MFFTLLAASTNGANVITNVDLTGSNVEVLSVDNDTGYSSMIGSNVEVLSVDNDTGYSSMIGSNVEILSMSS